MVRSRYFVLFCSCSPDPKTNPTDFWPQFCACCRTPRGTHTNNICVAPVPGLIQDEKQGPAGEEEKVRAKLAADEHHQQMLAGKFNENP